MAVLTLRVAACLAASECSEIITEEMLSATFTLVRRSVQDAVRITKGATSPKLKRQPLSLEDKVRARIEMHGGRAASSQVLPYVGATAAEVKELPGIVVTVERAGKTGRPATVFSLPGNTSGDSAPQPASAEHEKNRAPVVSLEAYRPAPKRAPELTPDPKRSEPLAGVNPFRALL